MDVSLMDLWWQILLAAVIVFVASSIIHMILPHHKQDFAKVPNEDAFLQSLRANNIGPGQYMFPYCDMKQMKDPEVKARWEAGPHGLLNVWAGMPNMGRNLTYTFIFYVVLTLLVAYLAQATLDRSADYLSVFRVAGTAAVLGYCFGHIPGAIWFGQSARSTVMYVIDGVVYGLLTAGTIAGFWPTAPELQVPGLNG